MIASHFQTIGGSDMTNRTNENWLPVAGTNGIYEISDRGNVRRAQPLRMLKGSNDGKSYLRVNLSINGRVTTRYIAHMVLEAFVGPRPEGNEARHLDGNPLNNSV